MDKRTYKVCMYYQFVPSDYEDTYYPGEDRLWFEILLDEYRNGHFFNTIDCNGFTAPLGLLGLSGESRRRYALCHLDKIADHIAVMLERNGVDEYSFDEHNEFKTVSEI